MNINPKIDMQKIVTLDGFGVRADPRDHFGKNATLTKSLVQPFEVVRGPHGPRISILGLMRDNDESSDDATL